MVLSQVERLSHAHPESRKYLLESNALTTKSAGYNQWWRGRDSHPNTPFYL
jgi:hypothetical protein